MLNDGRLSEKIPSFTPNAGKWLAAQTVGNQRRGIRREAAFYRIFCKRQIRGPLFGELHGVWFS
jgi:hypothetical protein